MTTETARQTGGDDRPARVNHAVADVIMGAGDQMVAETEIGKGAALVVEAEVEVEVKELEPQPEPVGHGLQISHSNGA